VFFVGLANLVLVDSQRNTAGMARQRKDDEKRLLMSLLD
jgi:hypothetical protein